MLKDIHETNRRYWNTNASAWKALRERDGNWRRCLDEPELGFAGKTFQLIQTACGDLTGRSVCVIASGDNYAAFALAGLGAHVTSTDISQKQLDVARERAVELGLDMRFVRADAADLEPIAPESFDLVCSTNGLYVWIASPTAVMCAVHRILKPGGFYVFYDVHPFQRPWKDQRIPIELKKPYWDVGPFAYEDPSFEFHWTMADFLNGASDAGLVLQTIIESPADDERFWEGDSYEPGSQPHWMNWQQNPRAGLPVWLTLALQKPEARRLGGPDVE